jgi:hypothetical protein
LISTTNGVSTAPQTTVLRAESTEKIFTGGLEGAINASVHPLCDLEVGFLGIVNWRRINGAHSDSSILVTNVNGVSDLYDWAQAANVETNYKQQLDYINIGPWFHSAPKGRDYFCVSAYGGLRYLYYYDKLQMTSQRLSDISHFYTTCKNDMAGGLFGLEFQANPMSFLSWSMRVVGGMYADFMKKTSTLHDYNDTTTPFSYSPNKVAIAYTFEFDPVLTFRAGRYLRLNVGYNFTYMANLAMSAYQIGTNLSNSRVYHDGKLRFQAATIGLGAQF